MAPLSFTTLIAFLAVPVWGLQVAPNSPCALICIDDPTQDPSDPNVSNTFGSDIVCSDAEYATTPVGQKFQACVSCLQNSTAVASGETDQAWFLYNIRFAIDTCIFGLANATDPIDSPCTLSTSCGPIEGALLDSMTTPTLADEYGYCTAFDNSFTGVFQASCGQCFRESGDQFYLSNFLTALNGGCIQQPTNGTIVGLNGTLFSLDEVQVVNPSTLIAHKTHKILSEGAIAGIVVGGIIVCLIVAAVTFINIRKRQRRQFLEKMSSPLNPRYGAENITAPYQGAYSSPTPSPEFYKEDIPRSNTSRPFKFSRSPQTTHQASQDFSNPSREALSMATIPPRPPSYSSPRPAAATWDSTSVVQLSTSHPEPDPLSQHAVSPSFMPPQPPQPPPASHPQRSPSVASVSTTPTKPVARSPSTASRFQRFSKLHARGPGAAPANLTVSAAPSQISGPIVEVGTRFEDAAQAKAARERLYNEGLGGPFAQHGERHPGDDVSPESTRSEELWPGNY